MSAPFTFHAPEHLIHSPVRIQVIGCGGTGSQMADALASMEVTLRALGHPGFRVSLHDADKVSRANVGRQRFCNADVGHYKAALLAHRINLFYGLHWKAETEHQTPGRVHGDVVVTCTDSAMFRAELGRAHRNKASEALWLDCGNGAADAQCILGHLGQPRAPTRRLPNVADLFPELATMQHADRSAPSCSVAEAVARQEWPVNRAVALAGVELLWNLLRNGRIEHHGVFLNTHTGASRPLAIDPAGWAMFGYAAG